MDRFVVSPLFKQLGIYDKETSSSKLINLKDAKDLRDQLDDIIDFVQLVIEKSEEREG